MPWQVTILIYSLLGAFRNVLSRKLGIQKKDYSLNALLYSFIAVFSVGLIYVAATQQTINSDSAWDARYFLLIGGMLFASINFLYLKLFRRVSASIGVFLILLSPLSVVLVSSLLTDESLTFMQAIGAMFILCAVFIAEKAQKSKKNNHKYLLSINLLIAIVIAAMSGFATVNEKYLLDRLGLDTYLIYGWGMQLFATILIVFLFKKDYKKVQSPKLRISLVIYALLLATSGFFFIQTLIRSDNAALTSISASFKTIVAVILAVVLLKEREKLLQKSISLLISVIGLFLLFT